MSQTTLQLVKYSDSVHSHIRKPDLQSAKSLNSTVAKGYTLYVITGSSIIAINDSLKLCVIDENAYKNIDLILETLKNSNYRDYNIWTGVELNKDDFINIIQAYVRVGFDQPYITNISPLKYTITPTLAIINEHKPTNQTTVLNKILHALETYKDKGCSLHARFSKRAVKFLSVMSHSIMQNDKNKKSYFRWTKGSPSQKELTGELDVTSVKKSNGKFVYIIDVNEHSVESGGEEDVDVSQTRYNFHSHPEQAYIRHSVHKAWPSITDYLGYFKLGNATIFHTVVSIEGMYIMSFGPHWGNNLKQVNKKFIEDNYHIDHKENYTPDEYAKKVNSILYKGYPIFNLQFIPWSKARKVFKVSFAKIGLACIPTQKTLDIYNTVN
jgi:hypothetical protein